MSLPFRLSRHTIVGLMASAASPVILAQCMDFTLPATPFSAVAYVSAANAAGDRLIVGSLSSISYLAAVPLPFAANQRFCAMQEMSPGSYADAFVPTAAERAGDFASFTGLLVDPLAGGMPFPFGVIPLTRFPDTWAWRIASTTLSFENLTQPGQTTVATTSTGPAPPAGFALGNPPTYYDISTTAVFSGSVQVCINYTAVSYSNEVNLRLFHYENGAWVDRTSSIDTSVDRICAAVDSLSPFAVFEGAMQVAIDIDPGSRGNRINPKSSGRIPVAILSTGAFDAFSSVNQESLRFGQTGAEPSLSFCNRWAEDVNKDGYPDLVCHFDTQETGFVTGSTRGILQGSTKTGTPLAGTDSVRIVGESGRGHHSEREGRPSDGPESPHGPSDRKP
jgi:hypothetical protein